MKTRTPAELNKDLARLMSLRQAQIDTLIAQIRIGVAATVAKHAAAPRNWGFAGDLGHVIEELNDVAEFLGQVGVR